jgi:hypothetical protein
LLGEFHGFAGFDGSGEVHYSVDSILGENAIESGAVGRVSDNQLCCRRNAFLVAVAQIVEDDDLEAFFQELGGDYASNVSSSSGDQDAIGHVLWVPQSEST